MLHLWHSTSILPSKYPLISSMAGMWCKMFCQRRMIQSGCKSHDTMTPSKNLQELLNHMDLKTSPLYKIYIFQCMSWNLQVWNFKEHFEISINISCPYIERSIPNEVESLYKIDLTAHKHFWSGPLVNLRLYNKTAEIVHNVDLNAFPIAKCLNLIWNVIVMYSKCLIENKAT